MQLKGIVVRSSLSSAKIFRFRHSGPGRTAPVGRSQAANIAGAVAGRKTLVVGLSAADTPPTPPAASGSPQLPKKPQGEDDESDQITNVESTFDARSTKQPALDRVTTGQPHG